MAAQERWRDLMGVRPAGQREWPIKAQHLPNGTPDCDGGSAPLSGCLWRADIRMTGPEGQADQPRKGAPTAKSSHELPFGISATTTAEPIPDRHHVS